MDGQIREIAAGEAARTACVVQAYSEARIAMDYRRVAALLHPDARFVMPANSCISQFSGECRGRGQICDMMRQSDAMLEFFDVQVLDLLVEGNRAAVRWSSMQRNRGTGTAMPVAGCAFVTQVDGLITEYIHYCDTAAVDALAMR